MAHFYRIESRTEMTISGVAPCGLMCDLCLGFQREKNRCSGCTTEGSKPTYCTKCLIANCPEKGGDSTKLCNLCSLYPCKRIKNLEKRYFSNYGESLMENFRLIEERGMKQFLADAERLWSCPQCGELLTVHRPQCLHCGGPNSHYKRTKK